MYIATRTESPFSWTRSGVRGPPLCVYNALEAERVLEATGRDLTLRVRTMALSSDLIRIGVCDPPWTTAPELFMILLTTHGLGALVNVGPIQISHTSLLSCKG